MLAVIPVCSNMMNKWFILFYLSQFGEFKVKWAPMASKSKTRTMWSDMGQFQKRLQKKCQCFSSTELLFLDFWSFSNQKWNLKVKIYMEYKLKTTEMQKRCLWKYFLKHALLHFTHACTHLGAFVHNVFKILFLCRLLCANFQVHGFLWAFF